MSTTDTQVDELRLLEAEARGEALGERKAQVRAALGWRPGICPEQSDSRYKTGRGA